MIFSLGPMSKNVVDTVIEYSNTYDVEFTFIPSRRQIDYNGGYVNNWTSQSFAEYILMYGSKKISIQRDHGGPGQGDIDDNGFDSMREDVKYFNSIHIDPWKKYPIYNDGLEWTIKLIQYCYALNPEIQFEVGTEEGIRPFSLEEVEQLLIDLKARLESVVFNQIKYIVIQCGTQLLEKENIGVFNTEKLSGMLAIAKKFNLLAKEHNGDWVSMDTVRMKQAVGLQHMNIAPEFGEIETRVLLKSIKSNKEDFDTFYDLCLKSGKWKKWVSADFNPEEDKEKLILICGHYIFSNETFKALKQKYEGIDDKIRKAITQKLLELDSIYTERKECIFCGSSSLTDTFKENKLISLSYSLLKEKKNGYFIPYNVQSCQKCNSFQTKYLGDLEKIYENNHIDNFGSVKKQMHEFFASFILENPNTINTVEVGACNDNLSRLLLESNKNNNIHIIDPYFVGNKEGLHIIPNYLESIDLESLPVNAVLMSSIFEHFYKPRDILQKLRDSKNIQYIYLNNPDLEYAIKNDIYINLTTEHTYYIENHFLVDLFASYGFTCKRKNSFNNHTICFEFVRDTSSSLDCKLINKTSLRDMKNYFLRMEQKINMTNTFMALNPNYEYYVWPTSMHLAPLFTNGLKANKLRGMLDNSPNKVGKFFYGYNLECFSFTEITSKKDSNICIFLGGSPAYRNELRLQNQNCKFLEI